VHAVTVSISRYRAIRASLSFAAIVRRPAAASKRTTASVNETMPTGKDRKKDNTMRTADAYKSPQALTLYMLRLAEESHKELRDMLSAELSSIQKARRALENGNDPGIIAIPCARDTVDTALTYYRQLSQANVLIAVAYTQAHPED